jgi:hypothetical protein
MTSLCDGRLDDITTYIDFDDNATHDKFWTTELESVRQYYIEFISCTGAVHYYNPYIMQELAYYNEPLDILLISDWKNYKCPPSIFLPYSKLTIMWNADRHTWTYDHPNRESLNPSGMSTGSSFSSYGGCSLLDPIDTFEEEDQELE